MKGRQLWRWLRPTLKTLLNHLSIEFLLRCSVLGGS